MLVLTFREDAHLRGRHEDLGRRIQHEQDEGVERRECVAEVDQSRNEDEDVEHQRPDIDQRHRGRVFSGGGPCGETFVALFCGIRKSYRSVGPISRCYSGAGAAGVVIIRGSRGISRYYLGRYPVNPR